MIWTDEQRARALAGCVLPVETDLYEPAVLPNSSTEPWTSQLAAATMCALGAKDVLELGTWHGRTGAYLCLMLERMGGGTYIGYDSSDTAVQHASTLIDSLPIPNVRVSVRIGKSPDCLVDLDDASIDFVWLDDYHLPTHVITEIDALKRIMRPNGIICGHDMYGAFDLHRVFEAAGGGALDLPRIVKSGSSGGIGFIQYEDWSALEIVDA